MSHVQLMVLEMMSWEHNRHMTVPGCSLDVTLYITPQDKAQLGTFTVNYGLRQT